MVGQQLLERGVKVNTGTIVEATIIAAFCYTTTADKARDPDMHQTRKGQQWYFGMKLHIGVDSQSGLAHQGKFIWPAPVDAHWQLERAQLDALVLGLPWQRMEDAGIITVV
jgi:IS5 family transposase